MGLKVCKFGGSSLASAEQLRKVRRIVTGDPERRFVVPSAPGRRHAGDPKVTDLLYLCHEHARQHLDFEEVFTHVRERYTSIVQDLEMTIELEASFETIRAEIREAGEAGRGPEYAASRGEFLNGRILAEFLGFAFLDAAEVIRFTAGGRLDPPATYDHLRARLHAAGGGVVIPGFYGADASGRIWTLSRGGSDVTGALVAGAMGAELYENWTDVPGLLKADPTIVENPETIDILTYQELRELAYMGATVLHDEAIFPVRDAGIPVQVRNTHEPDHPGSRIVPELEPIAHGGRITGIAGNCDFSVIALEKALMNREVGFGRRVLGVFETHGISFEHVPSGIDTLSVVVADAAIEGKAEAVMEDLRLECAPDRIELFPDMALIATVGRGMASTPGMAARLFTALAEAGVNVRMIDQGSSEINIIVGVDIRDFETAVRAIYDAFV